ncbi:GntR family transcriptional regulator [Kitasatospora cineracea]
MNELPDLAGTDEQPLYVQVAAVLRQMISTGELRAGDRVPGENVLIQRYGISRETARKALEELNRSGLITKIPKVGTFVREERRLERKPRRYRRNRQLGSFATEAKSAGRDPGIEATSIHVTATAEVAERLAVDVGAPVMQTTYRFLADGQPIQSSVSYEPLDVTGGTPVELPEEGPYANAGVILRMDSIGVRITKVTEEVTIRPPLPSEETALQIPAGVHVFHLKRTQSTDERPVETADIVIPGDRYALLYEFRVADEENPSTT